MPKALRCSWRPVVGLVAALAFCGLWVTPALGAGGPPDTGPCDVTVTSAAQLRDQNVPSNGQVLRVCLASGTYNLGGALAWRRADTVLRGIPDQQGNLPRLRGQLSIEADNVTVSQLDISYGNYGEPEAGQTNGLHQPSSLRLWADHLSLLDTSVRNPKSTCVEVGYADAYDERYQSSAPPDSPGSVYSANGGPAFHKVSDILIAHNRIGGCADDPWFLDRWTCNNSGFPGIYSQWVDGLEVRDNSIVDTALRGIQLFPSNSNVDLVDNLLRRNSIAMNIGTEDVSWTRADEIEVRANLFDRQTSQELANAHSNMNAGCAGNKFLLYNSPSGVTVDDQATEHNPTTTVDASVALDGNCGTNVRARPDYATSFDWMPTNIAQTAQFVSATDDHQTNGSPCASAGPPGLRPGGALEASGSNDGPKSIGDLAVHTYLVTNPTAISRTVTSTVTLPATGTAYARVEGPGCSGTTCSSSLSSGASATIRVTMAASKGGALSSGLTAASPGITSATAGASTTVSGSFCTRSGTPAADRIVAPVQQGTILCGFEGGDVLVPGHAGDQLRGGLGTDTVDFGSAAADAGVANRGWKVALGPQPASATMIPADPVNQDLLYSIESLTGTANGDQFTGGADANLLLGGGGADSLNGGDGDDALQGGPGSDAIVGGGGIDTVSYSQSTTAISARLDSGSPQATGGAGTDTLSSTLENLVGGTANDVLRGDAGANVINGYAGSDRLFGLAGNDRLLGGAGNDVFSGGDGSDVCDQGAGSGSKSGCEL